MEYKTKAEIRSFDPVASIDQYRFDLYKSGHILPETKRRAMDEELTYIAEGINRPLQTVFHLEVVEGEIAYFDHGQWRPYLSTLVRGVEVAEAESEADPRKQFLADRSAQDLLRGYRFSQMTAGEVMHWYSEFPDLEVLLYGEKFVAQQGFQVDRRMGFLYRAEKLADGSIDLVTQSVDNSDSEAFSAAMEAATVDPNLSMDEMLWVYDWTLSDREGDTYYAGRPKSQHLSIENAWEVIHQHQDLIEFYFKEIELLAYDTNLSTTELVKAKKRLTYGFWAALKDRLDKKAMPISQDTSSQFMSQPDSLRAEIFIAYQRASARGEVMYGCGGAIAAEEPLLDASMADVFESIFGNQHHAQDREVLKCVHCPLCNKDGVDASIDYERDDNGRVTKKVITCSECKKSKTYNS